MLISQPSVMWKHSGAWANTQSFCCWLSTLFPKIFATLVLVWATHGTVKELYNNYGNCWIAIVSSMIVFVLFLLSIYSYFSIIYIGAGSPTDFPELTRDQRPNKQVGPYSDSRDGSADGDNSQTQLLPCNGDSRLPPQEFLISHTFKNNATVYRWCGKCEVWKPDRCHHCSTCEKCFLRMDHHCPWFACCIGFRNHKFFIQFLVYVTIFSGCVCALSAFMVYDFFAHEQYNDNSYLSLNLVFLFVISLAFSFALSWFTAFSIFMVLRNYTTIEFQDMRWNYSETKSSQYEFDTSGKKKKLGHIYNLGTKENWKSVMGDYWYQWILPIALTNSSSVNSPNNGLNFKVDEELFQKYCANAQLQDQLNRQLEEYRNRVQGRRDPTLD